MQYLIANWKAQMTYENVKEWITLYKKTLSQNGPVQEAIASGSLTIVICPSYPFIPYVLEQLKDTKIHLGSQDVSEKESGKYTGEVTAAALKDMAEYAIVGHSERRSHFAESDSQISQKITQCNNNAIQPILCVRNTEDQLQHNIKIVAYEPVAAIGSGQNEDPALVVDMKKRLSLPQGCSFLYGGSVSRDNIADYARTKEIDGYLVGTASLDAEHFLALAEQLIQ